MIRKILFIKNCLFRIFGKIDKNTNNITFEPSIQLNHIVKLKLSELEVKRVFKYLENLNVIFVDVCHVTIKRYTKYACNLGGL